MVDRESGDVRLMVEICLLAFGELTIARAFGKLVQIRVILADVVTVNLLGFDFDSGRTGKINIRVTLAILLMWVSALPAFAADETFATLTVGRESFTNVTVLTKTRNDVFITHSRGMASLKVRELDTPTQMKLGYLVESPKSPKAETFKNKVAEIGRMESDPRVQAAEAELAARFAQAVDQFDPRIFYGLIAAIILSYLSFSSLCRSICMKAAIPPRQLIPLIWLPLLKQIPMLKAAGMSPAWILTNLVPGLVLVTYVVWSFKITKARGKNAAVAVFLLLPVTNLFAFLYLAMSGDTAGEKPSPPPFASSEAFLVHLSSANIFALLSFSYRQTDRHTDIQTQRYTDRQTDRHKNTKIRTNSQTYI